MFAAERSNCNIIYVISQRSCLNPVNNKTPIILYEKFTVANTKRSSVFYGGVIWKLHSLVRTVLVTLSVDSTVFLLYTILASDSPFTMIADDHSAIYHTLHQIYIIFFLLFLLFMSRTYSERLSLEARLTPGFSPVRILKTFL